MARRLTKPTTVLFVRHGRTASTGAILPGRSKGHDLSEEGRNQADAVAERIAAGFPNVDAVYASPLERTRQTAAPIGRAVGKSVKAHRGLLECDVGDWTGLKLKDVAKLKEWQLVQRAPSRFRFPGGESFLEMQARIGSAVEQIQSEHDAGVVVVVSHADMIKLALTSALGLPLDAFQRFSISPCSISVVQYGETLPVVLAVNALGDLKELAPS